MRTDRNLISYVFGLRQQYSYRVFAAQEIEKADDVPGIYSWHLRIPPDERVRELLPLYAQLLSNKKIRLNGSTSSFGEKYGGQLERLPFDLGLTVSEEVATRATAVFSPPIYIGVSQQLRYRLLQHRKAAEEEMLRSGGDRKNQDSESLPESDTEEESSYFGRRVGQALTECGITDPRWLFVKIVELQRISRKELLSLERLLNRAFLPHFGRR